MHQIRKRRFGKAFNDIRKMHARQHTVCIRSGSERFSAVACQPFCLAIHINDHPQAQNVTTASCYCPQPNTLLGSMQKAAALWDCAKSRHCSPSRSGPDETGNRSHLNNRDVVNWRTRLQPLNPTPTTWRNLGNCRRAAPYRYWDKRG